MIRVGVLDDHMIVHDGIRAMTERTDDLEFWGAAASGSELMRLLERDAPDVLLLDLRLAAERGFDVCVQVRELVPETRIVVFTAHGSVPLLQKAVESGAVGYVLKDASTRRLPEVLRHVVSQGSYFDPRLACGLVLATGSRDQAAAPGRTELTARERTVLQMIAQGRTNAEIAEELHFSYHTIKLCVSGLLTKLGAKRRTELVRIAAERRL